MIEKIAIGIISIILAIGVCGCMSNNNDSKKDVVQQEGSVKDMMMEHMREKYNEEFEFVYKLKLFIIFLPHMLHHHVFY